MSILITQPATVDIGQLVVGCTVSGCDRYNETGQEIMADPYSGNNSSGNSDESFEDPFNNPWFKCAFILLYSVVFFVCCFGNSVVLYTIARNKRMRTRTNFFLANLAAADLGVGTVCILPKLIQYLSSRWLLGEVMCKISYFAQNMTYTASIMLLTVIAIERYIAVLHPLRSKCIVTETRLIISQVIIWIVSAAYNSPDLHMFALYHTQDQTSNMTQSFCLPLRHYTNMRNYYVVNFVVWYILPLGIMIFMYTKVCITLWQTGKLSYRNSQNALLLRPMSNRESTPTRQETVLCYQGSVAGVHTRRLDRSPFSENESIKKCKAHDNNNSKVAVTLLCLRKDRTELESFSHFQTSHVKDAASLRTVQPCPLSAAAAKSLQRQQQQQQYQQVNGHRARRYFSCDYTSEGEATSSEDCDKGGNHPSPCAPVRNIKTPCRVHSHRVITSRRRVIKLLIVVMLTFAVCVLPTHLRLLLMYWEIYPDDTYDVLSPLSYVMLYGNSALNPILYWLFSDMFKRSFCNSLCCCREKNSRVY